MVVKYTKYGGQSSVFCYYNTYFEKESYLTPFLAYYNTYFEKESYLTPFLTPFLAKNYLNEEELKSLNLLVDAYLSFAEIQVLRKIVIKMEDWTKKLDEYLKFSSYEVLGNAGKISHEKAIEKADTEYQKFSESKMKNFESDFDREMKKILEKGKETEK